MQHLGRSDAVHDVDTPDLLPLAPDLRRKRLARRDAGAQGGLRVGVFRLPLVDERRIERRHPAIDRGPVGGEDLRDAVGRGPLVVEERRRAHRQREGHAVAEAVGEKQLGRREDQVAFRDPQHLCAVGVAGHAQRVVDMAHALRRAGGPRGIEPEGDLVPRTGKCLSRPRAGDEIGVGGRAFGGRAADHDDAAQIGRILQRGQDHGQQFVANDRDGGAAVGQDRAVEVRRQQRVDRDGLDARLQTPPEDHREFDLVVDDHRRAFLAPDARADQRPGDPRRPFGQIAIAQVTPALPGFAEGGLCRAAFVHMPVHEPGGCISVRHARSSLR